MNQTKLENLPISRGILSYDLVEFVSPEYVEWDRFRLNARVPSEFRVDKSVLKATAPAYRLVCRDACFDTFYDSVDECAIQ